jgi:hypothetical protein
MSGHGDDCVPHGHLHAAACKHVMNDHGTANTLWCCHWEHQLRLLWHRAQLLFIYTTVVSNDAWGSRGGRTLLAVFVAQVSGLCRLHERRLIGPAACICEAC